MINNNFSNHPSSVLAVILAEVDQQLTASTDILATIADYLFGKGDQLP